MRNKDNRPPPLLVSCAILTNMGSRGLKNPRKGEKKHFFYKFGQGVY